MSTAASRSSRVILVLIIVGVLLSVLVVSALTWWLSPRWAPEFTVKHSPFPDMVFRAVLADNSLYYTGVERLCTMGPSSTPTLIAHLQHPDQYARAMALDILKVTRDHRATGAVLALLDDPHETHSMKYQALRTLSEIGDPRAIPRLVLLASQLDRGQTWFAKPELPDGGILALQAVETLASIPGHAVGNILHPHLKQQELWVLLVFERSRDPRVPEWLNAEMLLPLPEDQTGTWQIRDTWQHHAALALADNPQPSSATLVQAALTDASPVRRKTAAASVANFISSDGKKSTGEKALVVAALLALLDDPDRSVAEVALMTLIWGRPDLTDEQRARMDLARSSLLKP